MQPDSVGIILCAGSFIAIGVGFAAIGRYLVRSAGRLARTGVRVPGEVVALRVGGSTEVGGGSYYPILRFRTVHGQDVETSSDIGTAPAPAREGDRVIVVYDPGDPRTARIDSALGRGTGIGWACIVGGGLLVLAAVVLGIAGLT